MWAILRFSSIKYVVFSPCALYSAKPLKDCEYDKLQKKNKDKVLSIFDIKIFLRKQEIRHLKKLILREKLWKNRLIMKLKRQKKKLVYF